MTVAAPERVVANGNAPKRRSWVVVAGMIGALVGVAVTLLVAPETQPSPSWQRVASYSELRTEEIIFVEDSNVFLVWKNSEQAIALSAIDGRGQPVVYCQTSGYFEDQNHGSKFDRLGRYALGPAPRGLDQFALLVLGDDVYIDRSQVMTGAPRFDGHNAFQPLKRSGSFCPGAQPDTIGPH
jgi:hypothetical protein